MTKTPIWLSFSPITKWLLASCVFVSLLGGIIYFRQDLRLQRGTWNNQLRDLFYLPSRKNLKRLSLGHSPFMADLIWTRTLLYAGSHFTQRSSIHWVPRYVDSIITLDPKFKKPYTWGAVLMLYNRNGAYRAHVYKSIALLKRGREQFPNDYQFPYQLALTYLYEIKFSARSFKQLQEDHKLFCKSDFFKRKPKEIAQLKELRANQIKLHRERMRFGNKRTKTWLALFRKAKRCMHRAAASMMLEASSKPNAPAHVARLSAILLKRGGNSNIVVCQHLQSLLWRADSKLVREQLRSKVKQYCNPKVLRQLFCREWLFTKRWQKQMPYIPRLLYQQMDLPQIYQQSAPLTHPLPKPSQYCQKLQ